MSCNSKRLVYDPTSCIFTVGRQEPPEIREIYTSLTRSISLQPGTVYYPSDDNQFCSCGVEEKRFSSPVAATYELVHLLYTAFT